MANRPDRVDGLLSSSRNAVVIAIALIGAVRNVIRLFQLRKINVLTRKVLNGRIRRFAERQGVVSISNHTARDGHNDARWIALDGNRMIWTWKLDLLFFHVSVSLRAYSALRTRLKASTPLRKKIRLVQRSPSIESGLRQFVGSRFLAHGCLFLQVRGLIACVGSGIHSAIHGKIRAGNVRGLRTGDERH